MSCRRISYCLTLVIGYLGITAPTGAQTSVESPASPRSLAELTGDVRTAMRGEATLTEPESWGQAVRALVALNDELRIHPKNRDGSSFEKLKRSVRRRLLKAQKKLATAEAKRENEERAPDQQRPDHVNDGPTALAQQAGGFRPGGGRRGGGLVGPGGAAGAGLAGGAAQRGDYGDTLVDLIERTIKADTWQSVGGPAVIMYHQPNHALIITAPADVHEDVSDLLRQLRAAGGP